MNLYYISQDVERGYDTYDSAVVCAKSQEHARNMHPGGHRLGDDGGCWARDPKSVAVRLIGKAAHTETAGVICASFNAG